MATLLLGMLISAVLSGCGESGIYATQKNFITIGCVCPLSGDLANYGEGTPEAQEEAVRALNENEGLYIDTLQRKLKVRFLVADSCSTEEGAKAAAQQLITQENVDVMICHSGNLTAKAVASVCEQEKVPFFSVNAEMDEWVEDAPYAYSFNCAVDQRARLLALADVWEEKEITSVGLFAVQSEEAARFAQALSDFCDEYGYDFTNPGFIETEADYAKAAKTLAKEKVESVVCFMDAEDFSAAFEITEVRTMGHEMCVLVNNHLFARDIEIIKNGAMIKELYTLTAWNKNYPFESSLTEENSGALGLWWEDRFLSSCSELLGYQHGCVEIAVDALKLAMALDADSIVSAAKNMEIDTVLGQIAFDKNNTFRLPCSVLHWTFDASTVSWKKELVSHAQLLDVEFDED